MSVTPGQKKAMADIMRAMNVSEEAPHRAPATDTVVDEGTMREIMERFRVATDAVRENAQEDHSLMEALQTERTATGVRISEWEIAITEQEGRAGKFYNISRDDIKIASDLRLYEAALLLTQELNKGHSITSPRVREILRLEEEFAKNLEDAARFARIAKKASGDKRMVAEHRYSDAKAKAISAKEQIKQVR